MQFFSQWVSPLGEMTMVSDGQSLTRLQLNGPPPADGQEKADLPVFLLTKRWLDAYFRGENPIIGEIPLAPSGTAFQQRVWKTLLEIPSGQTRTYGDIAREMASDLGKEKMSAQAIGQAVGRNPIWIMIPCHRCIGAKGALTGYAGGLDVKAWLLRHEGWKGMERI